MKRVYGETIKHPTGAMGKQKVARAWLALTMVDRLGGAAAIELAQRLGSPLEVLAAKKERLCQLGLRPRAAEAIASFCRWKDVDEEIKRIDAAGARLLTWDDPSYPELLRHISDPPPWLVVRGHRGLHPPAVALVGARRASPYGTKVAKELAFGLARVGITVVSGLAVGIDGAAHRGALCAGGATVAVLGSGVDILYPMQHRELAEEISCQGTLVSELPMGTLPHPGNFPRRNRVIAGLTQGVVVVEAAERSGSLITARCALDQGRDVFAVPGRVDSSLSLGANRLIQDGAMLVTSVDEIVTQIVPGLQYLDARSHFNDTDRLPDQEIAIFEAGPLSVDEFTKATGLDPLAALTRLLDWELRGFIIRLPGDRFERQF